MGQLEDLMKMKLCDIFSSSKQENQKSGRNKCVVNEGEKERFRKRNVERTKEKRKAGREEEGKEKKREGKKKQEEEWKIKLCYSVSLTTQKVKSIYCDQ